MYYVYISLSLSRLLDAGGRQSRRCLRALDTILITIIMITTISTIIITTIIMISYHIILWAVMPPGTRAFGMSSAKEAAHFADRSAGFPITHIPFRVVSAWWVLQSGLGFCGRVLPSVFRPCSVGSVFFRRRENMVGVDMVLAQLIQF